MLTKPFYLVIDSRSRVARRVRAHWPQLEPGEILVRMQLEVHDELIPQIQLFELEEPDLTSMGMVPVALPAEDPSDA